MGLADEIENRRNAKNTDNEHSEKLWAAAGETRSSLGLPSTAYPKPEILEQDPPFVLSEPRRLHDPDKQWHTSLIREIVDAVPEEAWKPAYIFTFWFDESRFLTEDVLDYYELDERLGPSRWRKRKYSKKKREATARLAELENTGLIQRVRHFKISHGKSESFDTYYSIPVEATWITDTGLAHHSKRHSSSYETGYNPLTTPNDGSFSSRILDDLKAWAIETLSSL